MRPLEDLVGAALRRCLSSRMAGWRTRPPDDLVGAALRRCLSSRVASSPPAPNRPRDHPRPADQKHLQPRLVYHAQRKHREADARRPAYEGEQRTLQPVEFESQPPQEQRPESHTHAHREDRTADGTRHCSSRGHVAP